MAGFLRLRTTTAPFRDDGRCLLFGGMAGDDKVQAGVDGVMVSLPETGNSARVRSCEMRQSARDGCSPPLRAAVPIAAAAHHDFAESLIDRLNTAATNDPPWMRTKMNRSHGLRRK